MYLTHEKLELENTDFDFDMETSLASVMFTGMEDVAARILNAAANSEELGCDYYIDQYAFINPMTKLVEQVLFIVKYEDGTQEDVTLLVDDDQKVTIYDDLVKSTGGDKLMNFMVSCAMQIHSNRKEYVGRVIDTFDDFLEMKDIRIPSSDAAMENDGYTSDTNAARIYGEDYDIMSDALLPLLGIDPISDTDKRLSVLFTVTNWPACQYYDEDYFYSNLINEGYTISDVERVIGKEKASHMKEYCEEHGLI